MRTRLLIVVGMMMSSGGFVIVNAYADCNINTDWPDAPCIDETVNGCIPQYKVDQWADYFDYKDDEEFTDSKRT